ncbi:twin-arginine protein translocation system subunit TatC [Pseudomonas sp. EGD-AK9]|uniref:twin-arginine translocase subunit TatC n=1 Tax=Pseudomonas sp. EGD-AK9 TaxID=1386078 RepID=UPI0003960AF8|nr:twin-arginine translocase subunit TatC [Pseudomonas sp. EGD-AK9]ERI50772.1 twin-arginine protein translocation system subunit TatC [Pseudomonas sp. EGD-AK9]
MSNNFIDYQEMPLVAHLTELRKRLLCCVMVILLLFGGLFYFSQQIYTLVAAPLRAYLPVGATMIATGVASPFLTPFKLTMMLALLLSMPVILHQIWSFIAPGLYKHEKSVAIPLLISSIFLFYSGIGFAYFVVFPIMFGFFASVTPEGVAMMTDIGQYLDFVLTLFFAFGAAFEIPVATFLLIWVGIVDVATLRNSRPYVIVGCFVIGMVLTPPDVFSQTLLALPMWILFEVGLMFGSMVKKSEEEFHGDASEGEPQAGDQSPASRPCPDFGERDRAFR